MILAVFFTMQPSSHAEEFSAREYSLKASFIYSFTKFIEWPPEAMPEGITSIRICIIGIDRFGKDIDRLKDQTTKGRSFTIIRIKQLRELEQLGLCHIAFIGSSESGNVHKILNLLINSSALTISDSPGMGEKGVMINFFMDRKKVRFEINLDAAKRAGLRISSRLLRLARIVKDEKGTEP